MFFILLINLSLTIGVIIYLFSFNNSLLHSKGPEIRKKTYGRMYTIKGEMNEEIYITMDNLVNNEKMPEIEFSYFSGMAEIGNKKGKVTAVKLFKDELRGYYYDEKYDIEKSGKAALATDVYINLNYGTNFNENTKNININGKSYTVEYTRNQFSDGMEAMAGGVLVRVSYDDFVSNIRPVSEVIIIFNERLDNKQEKIFRDEIRKLNNVTEIIIQPKETSDQKNYKIEMVIDTVLLLSALLCLIEIYEYIINKRKREFIVYRICGAKKFFVVKVLIIEILFLTAASFLVGTLLFLSVGHFGGTMKYIHFDIGTWFKSLAIVLCCMVAIALRLMVKLNKGSLADMKKEAMVK